MIEWKIYLDGRIQERIPGSQLAQDGQTELTAGLISGESYAIQVKFFTNSDGDYPVREEETVLDARVRLSKISCCVW